MHQSPVQATEHSKWYKPYTWGYGIGIGKDQTAAADHNMVGLEPPTTETSTGNRWKSMRKELTPAAVWNKAKQIKLQEEQDDTTYWLAYCGDFDIPPPPPNPTEWRNDNSICPQDLAVHHDVCVMGHYSTLVDRTNPII
jgi:hypothetical protein